MDQHTTTDRHPFETGLDRHPANFVPLSPVSFLRRAVASFRDKTAVIDGDRRFTYGELHRPLCAPGVRTRGSRGRAARHGGHPRIERSGDDRGAFCRAHAGRRAQSAEHPAGRRDDRLLAQSRPRQGADRGPRVRGAGRAPRAASSTMTCWWSTSRTRDCPTPPRSATSPTRRCWPAAIRGSSGGSLTTSGNPSACSTRPERPATRKGAVYSHRGAYLQALSNALMFGLSFDSVYLWTLPMFHCSGWSYPWAVVAVGGTQVCLRKVDTAMIFQFIARHQRHASLRRADRAQHAGPGAGRATRRIQPHGQLRDRRGGAAFIRPARHGGDRISRDPPLRRHGNLRPGDCRASHSRNGTICRLNSATPTWRARASRTRPSPD